MVVKTKLFELKNLNLASYLVLTTDNLGLLGYRSGRWILLICGDVIEQIHLRMPSYEPSIWPQSDACDLFSDS